MHNALRVGISASCILAQATVGGCADRGGSPPTRIVNAIYEKKVDDLAESLRRLEAELAEARENLRPYPVGAVVAFAGKLDQVPPGWLPCDGRDDHKVSAYPELAKVLDVPEGVASFAVPNCEGVFLRGLDPKGVLDSEGPQRKVRSVQPCATQLDVWTDDGNQKEGASGSLHDHSVDYDPDNIVAHKSSVDPKIDDKIDPASDWNRLVRVAWEKDEVERGDTCFWTAPTMENFILGGPKDDARARKWGEIDLVHSMPMIKAGLHSHKVKTDAKETRPHNMAVYYIIRAK